MARDIWKQIGGPASISSFHEGTLKQWIVRNIKVQVRNDHSPEIWPIYFAIVCWWIWKWRNNIVFGKSQENPIDVNQFLLARFEEVWRVLRDGGNSESNLSRVRRETFIKWTAPPHGWLALNTDGAAKGAPGPAGGGGVIRDCTGKMLYAFSINLGAYNAFMAEARAVHYGLELAARLNPLKIQVQLDSKALVSALNGDSFYGGESVHIVNICKEMVDDAKWKVEVQHIYQEANRAADWLANQGVNQNNKIELIQVPPLPLGRLLYDDVVGVVMPRLVLP